MQRITEIERHCRAIRGEDVERTPWEYTLPSATELKHMRVTCGMTRGDLADQIGYTESTIKNYEQGGNPPGRQYIERCLIVYKKEWPRGMMA